MRVKNLLLTGFRGHLDKKIVIKQYDYGTVISAFPSMQHIKPTRNQRVQRLSFKEAQKVAREFVAVEEQKAAYLSICRKGQRPYNAIISDLMVNGVMPLDRLAMERLGSGTMRKSYSREVAVAPRLTRFHRKGPPDLVGRRLVRRYIELTGEMPVLSPFLLQKYRSCRPLPSRVSRTFAGKQKQP